MPAPIIPGLSQEETDTYYVYENALRSATLRLMQLCVTMESIENMYTSQIQAIYVKITGGTNVVVPEQTDLAGAQSLNIGSQTTALETMIEAALATSYTAANRSLAAVACGGVNLSPP